MEVQVISDLNTFPKLLRENARVRGSRPAIREKDLGIWQSWTWAEAESEISAFACGLATLGFKRGDRLAIIGDNRPQLYWAMVAAQFDGGVPVPVYQDSVAEEMQFILEHADARFAIAEDQEQIDKLIEIWDDCPKLEQIIYKDPRGLKDYDRPFIHSLNKVQEQGRLFESQNPGFSEEKINEGEQDWQVINW